MIEHVQWLHNTPTTLKESTAELKRVQKIIELLLVTDAVTPFKVNKLYNLAGMPEYRKVVDNV